MGGGLISAARRQNTELSLRHILGQLYRLAVAPNASAHMPLRLEALVPDAFTSDLALDWAKMGPGRIHSDVEGAPAAFEVGGMPMPPLKIWPYSPTAVRCFSAPGS